MFSTAILSVTFRMGKLHPEAIAFAFSSTLAHVLPGEKGSAAKHGEFSETGELGSSSSSFLLDLIRTTVIAFFKLSFEGDAPSF